MKPRNFFFLLSFFCLASCKNPLPIYFDKPVGDQVTTFPESMKGYYYSLDDIKSHGKQMYEEKYCLQNGKIVKKITNIEKDSVIAEESNVSKDTSIAVEAKAIDFSKIVELNQLAFKFIDDSISKGKKIEFGCIRISKDLVSAMLVDSAAKQFEIPLLKLNTDLVLTKSADNYYLNLKTTYGWEIIQITSFTRGDYLNFSEFYFTTYNDKTEDAKEFIKSTEIIYPNLKPIYNSSKKIIGFKAKTNISLIEKAFKNSEATVGLLKVE